MHEHLPPLKPRYGDCRRCGKRTAHGCVKCGYCYSCHPVIEALERRKVRVPAA